MSVAVKRLDLSASELRQAAKGLRDATQVRRVLALALVLEGASRTEAATACGMDRQTLRDWVHRYNAEGIDGLIDREAPGRPPRLTPAQEAELKAIVLAGPDLARDGVVRWRRIDLQRVIGERFDVRLHERTVGKILDKLGFKRLSVRPQHPASDPEAQVAFKKTSSPASPTRFPRAPSASRSRSGSRTKLASARREA